MTAPAQAPPKTGGGKSAPVMPRPFVAGTRRIDQSNYDQTRSLTSGTQDLPPYEVSPNGFLSGLYCLVQSTTAGNAATVAFTANGPWNVIDSITFNDVNNKAIIGPMTGHDLYEAIKFGGYAFVDDAKLSPVYSVTTGAGATGGSFTFILRLPIEIVRRDALGSLTNKSASATYDVSIRLAASSTVYSVAPTNAASVRVRLQQYGWMDPNDTDMRGNPVSPNPPAAQTTQYWSKQTYTLNAGAFNFRLTGIDSLVRNMIFMLLDGSNSRTQGDSDWPDPFDLTYETAKPISRIRDVWRHMIAADWGYTGTVETAGGRDYGVYPETYCLDFNMKPGGETRLQYLPVSSATNISVSGTCGGSGTHTLVVLVNKVVPANGDPRSLTGV